MDIELTDEMYDPDTVIGFLYEMCLEQPYCEEQIHSDVENYLQELEKYIIDGNIEMYGGYINIDPSFFRRNRNISMEIFPILASNIKKDSNKDITITSGNYILNLDSHVSCGRFMLQETGSFKEIQPPFPIFPPEISTRRSFPEYTTAYDAGMAFVKNVAGYKTIFGGLPMTINDALKRTVDLSKKAQTS